MSIKTKMEALADAIRLGTGKSSKMTIEDMILNVPLIKKLEISVTPALFDRSITNFDIPLDVTKIGCGAFSYCSHLTSVTIPEGVISIGDHAFSYCTALSSITLPSSISSIGTYAFSQSAIESIVIPTGVTTIGSGTFNFCDKLKSVTLPSSIESIDRLAFFSNRSLTDIYCNFAEGAVDGAPWGAPQNVNIHYNT